MHLLQCLLQISHMSDGFDLLQLEILGRAFADSITAKCCPLTPCEGHDLGLESGMSSAITLQFVDQAQLKPSPLPRDFAQVVALLPALKAVRSGVRVVLTGRPIAGFPRLASQPAPEGVEQVRDVVVQLYARQRSSGRHMR